MKLHDSAVSTIEDLESLYIFRERAQILSFISEHPFLVSLLAEASVKINSYFPGAPLYLEIFYNPETVGETSLTILIGTSFDAKETLKRLDQLDDAWWLDALDQAQGRLSINLEFIYWTN